MNSDGNPIRVQGDKGTKPIPVLFVHGHNAEDPNDGSMQTCDSDPQTCPNFIKNWFKFVRGFVSFSKALTVNQELGIEPYFIRFVSV